MLQLSRDDLIRAYTQMRTIRVFEDRVHDEFAAGKMPARPWRTTAGPGARSFSGIVHELDAELPAKG